jgi:ferredoxin--NADP+ reductase
VQTALEAETYRRLVGSPLDPQECHIFLSGNPAMIDEVRKLLEDPGFVADSQQCRGNFHVKRYW